MKEKGIFINTKVWTIKNLNLNEKIILSDIYNKSKLKDFVGYNKKNETLEEETGIKIKNIKKAFEKFSKEKILNNTVTKKKKDGEIKTILNNRTINWEVFNKLERFEISKENKLNKDNKGIFINFKDLNTLNGWYYSKDDKKLLKKLQQENTILFLLLNRAMFYDEIIKMFLMRIEQKELSELLDISTKTVYRVLEEFKKNKTYKMGTGENTKEYTGQKLYKVSEENFLMDLIEEIILDFKNEVELKKEKYTKDKNLYMVNDMLLKNINLDFNLFDKNTYAKDIF